MILKQVSKLKIEKFVHFFLIALIIFSFFLVVFNLIHSIKWINKPFSGFSVYSNLLVNDVFLSKWTGAKSGIKPFDKVTEINDYYLESSNHFYKLVEDQEVGSEVSYTVLRNGEYLKFYIKSINFSINDFLVLFVQFIIGIAFIIIGATVYFSRPYIQSSRVFLFFCLCIGMWFVSDFDVMFTHKHNLALIFQFIFPATMIHLASVFPVSRLKGKTSKYILIFYLVSLGLILLHTIYFNQAIREWVLAYTVMWFYVFLSALFFLILNGVSYFRLRSNIEKQRSKVIFLGCLLGLLVPALLATVFIIYEISGLVFLAIPVLFFPLSIAYAIVKHKLFDIQLVVNRALVYGFSSGAIAVLFIITLFLINLFYSTENLWKNPMYLLGLSVAVVLAINPLQNFIQKAVDSIFFRKKYNYQSSVSEFSDILSTLLSIPEISNHLIYSISETLFVESGNVFVLNKKSGNYESESSIPPGKSGSDNVFLDQNDPLFNFLYKDRKEVFREDIISEPKYFQYKDEILKSFNDFNAAIIFPLFFKKDVLGFLVIGNKKSGQLYTSEDMALLKTFVSQTAIAIENSFSFDLVRDYADELEDKNEELKSVQGQLVQAEKMSAIGYLSSGIAHEIRNPLNIIEGARYYLASMIDNGGENRVADEYLEYIQNEVVRTNKLIDSMLNFSKFSQNDIEEISINNVIDNVLVLSRKQLSDNNVKIVKNYGSGIPSFEGNSNQLWQVVINLLMNSMQSMSREGEIFLETGFYTRNEAPFGEFVFFKVIDNGSGIDQTYLSQVFDPFFTNKADGTGLGLSVSYKIIESHGGNMLVSSKVGIGTCFMVEIPVDNKFGEGAVGNDKEENLSS